MVPCARIQKPRSQVSTCIGHHLAGQPPSSPVFYFILSAPSAIDLHAINTISWDPTLTCHLTDPHPNRTPKLIPNLSVSGKSMKAAHLINVSRFLPFNNGLDLFGVWWHSFRWNHKSHENNLWRQEGTLLEIHHMQFLSSQGETNLSQMIHVLLLGATVDKNAVKVDDKKFAFECS